MNFHNPMVTEVPELLPSTTMGQRGQYAAYIQDLCILQQSSTAMVHRKRMVPCPWDLE